LDGGGFFEKNLLALSRRSPGLCAALRAARHRAALRYSFLRTPSGETIPAGIDSAGTARPLHSVVDPKREAERLVSAAAGDADGTGSAGFMVFLGLGAGFAPSAALRLPNVSGVLAIDYGLDGIAGLFGARDYSGLLDDPRFTLLADPSPGEIESLLPELYRPALCGGIRVLPLRARVGLDKAAFAAAAEAVRRGIEKVSADYSVQAHFGTRWFANIVRNVAAFRFCGRAAPPPPVRDAVVCAAGPSLDAQLPLLLERAARGERPFVISSDTALPALLHVGLKPDAVVSIDCQHVGYLHFMGSACGGVPLFLDIASPPAFARFSGSPFFFSGGHPLAAYLCEKWMRLPVLDVSGGNVAFACLSLAEKLGADRVTVCGADFSYPAGRIYARGSYVFPYFEGRQNRLSPIEAKVSGFLFRAPFLPEENPGGVRRYETATMRSYRLSFGRKMSEMRAEVTIMPGLGIPPVAGEKKAVRRPSQDGPGFARAKPMVPAREFLESYMRDVLALPALGAEAGGYARGLSSGERRVFATLLPQLAALKRRSPELRPGELLAAAKLCCANEIGRALG